MAEILLLLLKIFVVVATAGSLLELGLQLELRQTVVGVRNPRFALLTLLCGFALGPAPEVIAASPAGEPGQVILNGNRP